MESKTSERIAGILNVDHQRYREEKSDAITKQPRRPIRDTLALAVVALCALGHSGGAAPLLLLPGGGLK
jgi:hypothetical protein